MFSPLAFGLVVLIILPILLMVWQVQTAKPKFDWDGFFVRFILGAIFGMFSGFRGWSREVMVANTPLPGYIFIVTSVLYCGLIFGLFGESMFPDWFK